MVARAQGQGRKEGGCAYIRVTGEILAMVVTDLIYLTCVCLAKLHRTKHIQMNSQKTDKIRIWL